MATTTSPDGTTLAYEVIGDGSPVVVVDGMLCTRDVGPAREVADALRDEHAVVIYDRRGRGGSGDAAPRATGASESIAREVADLSAIIAAAAGGSAAVYGISSGAVLAVHAAAAGLAITRLVLFEPPLDATADPAAQDADLRQLEHLLAHDLHDAAVTHVLTGMGLPPEVLEGMRGSPSWAAMIDAAPSTVRDYRLGMAGALPSAVTDAVRVSLLAIAGGASFPFMQKAAKAVAGAVPDGTYLQLDDIDHTSASGPIVERAVAPFLR